MGVLSEIVAALQEPWRMFFTPAERVFWPALASAVVLALVVLGMRRGARALWHGLVAPSVWLHPSSRTDVTLLFAKAVGGLALRVPWVAATMAVALEVGLALHRWIGAAPELGWSPLAVTVAYTIVLFVAWDLSRFALHWAMHATAWLWTFHQVHHSAEVLTPLTLYRTHPVETALYEARGLVTTAAITGLFLWLFHGTAQEWQLLGVNAIGFAFNVVGGNLRHSHVWLRFGWLERFVLSPAQHQLHHGREIAEQNTNYGTWLALWDRLLGSWRASPLDPIVHFGLERANHRADSVVSVLVGPIRETFVRLLGRRRWSIASLLALVGAPRAASAEPSARPAPAPHGVEAPAGVEVPEPIAPPPSARTEPETPLPPADEGVDFELDVDDAPTEPATAPAPAPDIDVSLAPIAVVGAIEDPMRVAGSGHVVTEKELERKEYDDIHRTLAGVPGVYVREEDGFGLRPNIGLRGASSDRSSKVTLMEDGILLGPAPYSAPAAYYFPLPTRLVGVQVIKGPASIRFGPNTIGGAINMQTRPIPQKMTGAIDLAAGMRGYFKAHGWWGKSWKHFGLLLEGARVQSNGFKELDGGGETGFDKNELMLKARYNVDPGRRVYHQVDLKAGFANELSYETYLGITDDDFADDPYRRYVASQQDRMQWWRSQVQLGWLVARGSFVDFEVQAYRHDFHRKWHKFNRLRSSIEVRDILADPDTGQNAVLYGVLTGTEDSLDPDQALLIGTNDRRFVSQGVATVTHIRPTWRWLKQDIEIGARFHNDSIDRNHTEDAFLMFSGALVPEGSETVTTTRNRGSAFAGAFHVVDTIGIKNILTLTPGARVEVIHTRFDDELADAQSNDTNTVFIPGIGAHVLALPWLGVLAGVHSGFSPVSPGQADEVKPERSINYEAGARVHQVVGRTNTRVEAIGFFNDYSNMTSECTFSSGCDDSMINEQFNAGRVYVYGVEALAAERIDTKHVFLELGASYTYTGSRFRSSFMSENPLFGMVEEGDELPYVPEHLVAGNVGIGGKIWGVQLNVSYVGPMRDVAGQGDVPAPERVPDHVVLDLDAQVSITKRASLYLGIDNLLNTPYIVARRPFGARPGMPLQVMGGFKFVITR
jgi:Fe(3+) dicitrate transport protein